VFSVPAYGPLYQPRQTELNAEPAQGARTKNGRRTFLQGATPGASTGRGAHAAHPYARIVDKLSRPAVSAHRSLRRAL
jgi:hypothetical protein